MSIEVYITDALRMITESTAKYAGGPYMTGRYIDLIRRKPADARSGEEIAEEVIEKCGVMVKQPDECI